MGDISKEKLYVRTGLRRLGFKMHALKWTERFADGNVSAFDVHSCRAAPGVFNLNGRYNVQPWIDLFRKSGGSIPRLFVVALPMT
jgi:hypothetical protein